MSAEQTREVVTEATPLGKSVIFKTYLTALEFEDVRKAGISLRGVQKGKGELEVELDYSAEATIRGEHALVNAFVTSYADSDQNILERIRNAPKKEMAFILQRCNELSKDEDFTQK